MLLESLEYFADPFHVLVKGFCVTKYVVKIRETVIISQGTQHLFHTPLEGRGDVREAKRDTDPFIQPPGSNESSEVLGVFGDKTLMIGLSLVKDCWTRNSLECVSQVLYPR